MADLTVIGAGLAGACVASALAKHGLSVLVLEKAQGFATLASGNRDAILAPYLADRDSPQKLVYDAGFKFSANLLKDLPSEVLLSKGATHLASTKRLKRIFAAEGWPESLDLPEALVVDIRALVEFLLKPPQIEVQYGKEVTDLDFSKPVVLASAYQASKFPQLVTLRLEAVRGETWLVPESSLVKIEKAVLGEVYITPARNGYHLLGASYLHGDMSLEPKDSELDHAVKRLARTVPEFKVDREKAIARVCFRTSTHDRLPYVGTVSGYQNLYLALGFGSRGLTCAPLAGEIIAKQIVANLNKQEIESDALTSALSPDRVKAYKNNKQS